jgi:hypothetical protein
VFASGAQFLVNDANDKIDYISDLFVFGTGIFAAILFVLSLNAYTNLKTKRLLLVSIAFALFSVNVMLSRRIRSDNRIIDIRSDIGDLDFRERLKPKTTTDPSSPRF